MAIKIKPSNIFDIDFKPITHNAYSDVSVNCKSLERKVGSLTNGITITFYEKSQDENGDYQFTDVRESANEDISGTVTKDPNPADAPFKTIVELYFSLEKLAKIEVPNYATLRVETTYSSATTGADIKNVTFYEGEAFIDVSNPERLVVRYTAMSRSSAYGHTYYYLYQNVYIEGKYAYENPDQKIGVSLEDSYFKKMLELPSNELVQAQNLYGIKLGTTDRRENYAEVFTQEILDNYKNGKETATLLCSIGKYYDLDGNLVIDAESKDGSIPPLLKKYNLVVPYVMTANGEKPLSEYANGDPKQFQIIGVNISYNGIARQEIIIQEYKETS